MTAPGDGTPEAPGGASAPRRAVWPLALALIWLILAVTDLALFGFGHGSLSAAANPAASPTVAAPGHRASAPPTPTRASAAPRPAARPRVLVPASAAAVGPAGLGSGDNTQIAYRAIDASPATAWLSDWYRTARFGNLEAGTGLLIDLGHRVRITRAQILLGSARGADLQLRTGNTDMPAKMRLQASADDAGGLLRLNLASPERARYLVIWFTLLPPDGSGTYRASVYNVRLTGT
jgi:hypothetical protein